MRKGSKRCRNTWLKEYRSAKRVDHGQTGSRRLQPTGRGYSHRQHPAREAAKADREGVSKIPSNLVTVQVPQSIFLDFCSEVCHFSLDECESGSRRKGTRGRGEGPPALQPAQP